MSTSSPRSSGKSDRRAAGAASASGRTFGGLFAAAAVVAVAACGGGGGGGGNVIGPPGPPPGPINWGAPARLAQNAPALSQRPAAAISSTGSATVFWSQIGLIPPGGVAPSATPLMAAAENTGATPSAAWTAAAAVESGPSGAGASDPITDLSALAPATGAWAVWRRGTAAGDRLQSVRRVQAGWDALNVAALPAPATASGLVAAANDAGLQAAAWVEPVSGVNQVRLSIRNVGAGGTGWSAPMSVQVDPLQVGASPAVAIDAAGLVMIVWRQSVAGAANGLLRSRIYNPSSSQFSEERVLDPLNALNDMRNPRVAALAGGQFVATWEQANAAAGYDLRSTRWSGPNNWLSPPSALEFGATSVSDTQLAAGPGQTALALWRQNGTLYLNRLAAGIWGVTPLQVGASLTSGTSLEPRIGVDAAGNAIIVWAQQSSGGTASDLYYATFNATASTVSSAALLAANALTGSAAAALAVGANGSAVVAWPQAATGQPHPDLWARIFRP